MNQYLRWLLIVAGTLVVVAALVYWRMIYPTNLAAKATLRSRSISPALPGASPRTAALFVDQ